MRACSGFIDQTPSARSTQLKGIMMIHATYLFSGFIDFWGGDGARWDDNKGCLFSHYGVGTTLREIVDGWAEDFCNGGDCDSFPEEITDSDIRIALLDILSPTDLEDYHSNAVAECAIKYAADNGLDTCKDCGQKIGEFHESLCTEGAGFVEDCDCEEDDSESPVCIVLIEVDVVQM